MEPNLAGEGTSNRDLRIRTNLGRYVVWVLAIDACLVVGEVAWNPSLGAVALGLYGYLISVPLFMVALAPIAVGSIAIQGAMLRRGERHIRRRHAVSAGAVAGASYLVVAGLIVVLTNSATADSNVPILVVPLLLALAAMLGATFGLVQVLPGRST